MLRGPDSDINESFMLTFATDESSASMLPKSPTCLTSSDGAPWVLPKGLKWGPELIHPKNQCTNKLTFMNREKKCCNKLLC